MSISVLSLSPSPSLHPPFSLSPSLKLYLPQSYCYFSLRMPT